jgi:hypothetical protein
MRIAIIDGVNQDIGLKILFPEASYYIFNSEECTIHHRYISYNKYNFTPLTDMSSINDVNFDILFIIIATHDIISHTPNQDTHIKKIFDSVTAIINNNNFKFVGLFDNYDYDYDPNIYINNPKINLFFKRNYNKTKKYKENVVPFPFIMFGEKSLIEKCDTELVSDTVYFKPKNNRIFFSGILFTHNDKNYFDYKRDRLSIYKKIQHWIYNPGILSYASFIETIQNSKYSLDLLGVGDPNKRTFEILLSGSLMISEYNDLVWPFEDGDSFFNETIFKNENEFFEKIRELEKDNELYIKCLRNQNYIVTKYFNKNWIRSYILSKITCYLHP